MREILESSVFNKKRNIYRIKVYKDVKVNLTGDRRPTLQPVRGVTYEPSLPNGMRRACGREAIRLERRRGVGALLRSA